MTPCAPSASFKLRATPAISSLPIPFPATVSATSCPTTLSYDTGTTIATRTASAPNTAAATAGRVRIE